MKVLYLYHLSTKLNKAFCALTNVYGGVVRVQNLFDSPGHKFGSQGEYLVILIKIVLDSFLQN